MIHLLPDVPVAVVIAHFLALGALFGPPIVRRVERWQLKRQLDKVLTSANAVRPDGRRQLEPVVSAAQPTLKPH